MNELLRYSAMQKLYYDASPHSEEALVGNYAYHENFPYETHILHRYGDLRRPVLDNPGEALGFDIGCGEGRMIRRMARLLRRVDGADISDKMVTAARDRSPIESQIYLSAGANCGDAESDTYDIVYNTISLHHICVHDIRASILQDITRILKPSGCATLQFFFSRTFPFSRAALPVANTTHLVDIYQRDFRQADWFENRVDAQGTNSACDAGFGPAHIPGVLKDFQTWFEEVDVWFVDISIGRPVGRELGLPRLLPETHPNCHETDGSWFSHMAFFHLRSPRK